MDILGYYCYNQVPLFMVSIMQRTPPAFLLVPATMSTSRPPNPPQYPNPPTHHFSTIIYPNRAVLTATTSDQSIFDSAFSYGRMGGPIAHTLQSLLSTRLSSHKTLLTSSSASALIAATTPFLRAGAVLLAPQASHADLAPLLEGLLPRLSVSILRYATPTHLTLLLASTSPAVVLLQSPTAPAFTAVPAPPASPAPPVYVLHTIGLPAPHPGIDIQTFSADRSGGLLDSDASLVLGVISVANEALYRKVRNAVRGHYGAAAAAPSPDDVRRALFSLRTADARRRVQVETVNDLVRFLQEGNVPGVDDVQSSHASLDIAMRVEKVDEFLDNLQLIRIADGLGGGHSTTFAWPCWANDIDFDNNHVVLSVGLESVADLQADISQAAHST